jgi:hypothetical protein
MSNLILAILSGSVLTLLIGFLYSRVLFWRTQHLELSKLYADVLNKAIMAERRRAEIETEHMYLKNTISQIAGREVIAVLSDGQMQQLVTMFQQLATAALMKPEMKN